MSGGDHTERCVARRFPENGTWKKLELVVAGGTATGSSPGWWERAEGSRNPLLHEDMGCD